MFKIGDAVTRKSYNNDIVFKIIDIKDKMYILKGINVRLVADSTLDDLVLHDGNTVNDESLIDRIDENLDRNDFFYLPGKILHIDGDEEYLETCLKVYKQLSLDAVGKAIAEKEQWTKVIDLVKEVKPDIVVLTGHDSVLKSTDDYLDLENYRNTKYYIEAVKALRDYNSSYDELVIFAGACQSCYECLLDAGANFASSPSRVLIHCLDPVFVCEKIAYTKIDEVVSITDVVEGTITGIKGIGGLQTRGKYREGYPKSNYI